MNHDGNDVVEYGLDFCFVAFLETGVTDADDFVKIVFDTSRRLLIADLGTETFEVYSQFLCLELFV